nr:hypothetical protein [Tanacetum cinerariifolium]
MDRKVLQPVDVNKVAADITYMNTIVLIVEYHCEINRKRCTEPAFRIPPYNIVILQSPMNTKSLANLKH